MKSIHYIFPFDEVSKGSKIIIYGAGVVGKIFLEQIRHLNYYDCLFIVDSNYEKIRQLNGTRVCDPREIIKCEYDKVVISSMNNNEEIYNILLSLDVPKQKIVRKIVEYEYDIDSAPKSLITPDPENSVAWDIYYNKAENDAKDQFNDYLKPILSKYENIKLDKVLDFACGHGRMTNIFSNISKSIMCCDINATAIDFCRSRFQNNQNCLIEFLNNKRKDNSLESLPLENNSLSFIYTWDAMVHFSYKWLDFYIKEFYRILSNRSYVVIHHSNYTNVGDNSSENWYDHPHWRASVDYKDVAFIAQNHGFTVVEQRIIDWGGEPNLDCISILKKA